METFFETLLFLLWALPLSLIGFASPILAITFVALLVFLGIWCWLGVTMTKGWGWSRIVSLVGLVIIVYIFLWAIYQSFVT